MSDSLRIVFAGTPEFSVPPLRALIAAGHQLVGVYTQPDRPAGRGRKLTPSPVKAEALAADIPVFQPISLKDPDAQRELAALKPDLMVVVAYGLLLPQAVLDIPRLGCVNIHASLLPRWRGAAPIQRAILAGDSESGVGIMRMEAGLDTGPVYLERRIPVEPGDTGGSLHDKLARLGAEALMAALPGIADGSLVPVPQDDARTCYAKKLDKAEAEIDWTRPAVEIARQVHAFNPWPVAQTRFEDAILRIWNASPVKGEAGNPGMVMSAGRHGIEVATGDGLLRITRLQMPGKKPVSAADFINAYPIQGVTLG
jgi:methionyl-tRNA formyltransferase